MFQKLLFRILQISLRVTVALDRLFHRREAHEFSADQPTLIALESGTKGWLLIEYQELYLSAVEYLGVEAVHKVIVPEPLDYFKEVKRQISHRPVTHYFYDPRTVPQSFWRGTISTLKLSVYLARRNIIPIVRLTDVPHRYWRFLSVIVNATGGICLTLMFPGDIKHLFPHKRVYGPFMMPFSFGTFCRLNEERTNSLESCSPISVQFVGSLYEPRTSFLKTLGSMLNLDSIDLKMHTRSLGDPRISDADYWSYLVNADINVTTSDQISGRGIDALGIPHLIYRYTEVLVSGSALVATYAPSSWKYFRPGIDYAAFSSTDEAQQKIVSLIDSPERRRALAFSGNARAGNLIESAAFWRSIDLILGRNGFSSRSDLN